MILTAVMQSHKHLEYLQQCNYMYHKRQCSGEDSTMLQHASPPAVVTASSQPLSPLCCILAAMYFQCQATHADTLHSLCVTSSWHTQACSMPSPRGLAAADVGSSIVYHDNCQQDAAVSHYCAGRQVHCHARVPQCGELSKAAPAALDREAAMAEACPVYMSRRQSGRCCRHTSSGGEFDSAAVQHHRSAVPALSPA